MPCGRGPFGSCTIAQVHEGTQLELTIAPLDGTPGFLAALVDRLLPELQTNRSTLIFTNTRSLTERLAWALRRRTPAWEAEIAFAALFRCCGVLHTGFARTNFGELALDVA